MRRTAAWVVFCPLLACTPRDDAAPPPATPVVVADDPPARDRTFDPVSVQFHVVGETPRKPPLVELAVDVVILNHASESRWVLLPRVAGARPLERGGVDVLEVERWGGRLVVGNWLGTGGYRAVRIGADADVRMRATPVAWWRDDPAAVEGDMHSHVYPYPSLEAVAVRALVVDGQRAEEHFSADPTAPAGAAGGLGGDAATREVVATVRHRPDGTEVPVELLEPIEIRYVPWPRD